MSGCHSGEEVNITGLVEASLSGGFAVICHCMYEGVESTVKYGSRESQLVV